MCTYRESPDFQLFQNWNHFNYSQYIRELKDDRKMDDLARISFRKETLFHICFIVLVSVFVCKGNVT